MTPMAAEAQVSHDVRSKIQNCMAAPCGQVFQRRGRDCQQGTGRSRRTKRTGNAIANVQKCTSFSRVDKFSPVETSAAFFFKIVIPAPTPAGMMEADPAFDALR